MTEQEFQNKFTIRRLDPSQNIGEFDCLDEDLNDFIQMRRQRMKSYIKNDYQFLNNDDEDKNTRVMYFDLASLL